VHELLAIASAAVGVDKQAGTVDMPRTVGGGTADVPVPSSIATPSSTVYCELR
jgi:hypothetical protein